MTLSLLLAAMQSSAPVGGDAARLCRAALHRLSRSGYDPLARPKRIFAPPLVAAIDEEARLSQDEVGFMDADPLCQCQDASGIRPVIRKVRRLTRSRATAHILLAFSDADRRDLGLQLTRTRAGWRIADTSTLEEPSLLRDLQRWNRRHRRP